jgi:hypothetical protein
VEVDVDVVEVVDAVVAVEEAFEEKMEGRGIVARRRMISENAVSMRM